MKMPLVLGVVTLLLSFFTHAALVVVEDIGGTSALPYYRTLNLPTDAQSAKPMTLPAVRMNPYGEADMLGPYDGHALFVRLQQKGLKPHCTIRVEDPVAGPLLVCFEHRRMTIH